MRALISRLVPHGCRVFVLATALLLASCGAPAHSTSVEMTEAEVACVDFYGSVEESTEEEATYMRVLADRIAEADHPEAAPRPPSRECIRSTLLLRWCLREPGGVEPCGESNV